MKTEAFRAAPTWRLSTHVQVDRENLVLRGLVAMQADVEALGHGVMTDRRTLELMVALANVPGRRPIRGRFGHPGISENATGKQVMTSHNYRIVTDGRGTFLVHDAQLLEAARVSPVFGQDPVEYILTMAETAPSEFAESVVIHAYTVWTRPGGEVPVYEKYEDEDGDMVWRRNPRPADALTLLPVLRPTDFYYTDFVNEGALTHGGMFGRDAKFCVSTVFDGYSSAYAAELFDLVDRWREAYKIAIDELPGKVESMVSKYMAARKDVLMAKKNGSAFIVEDVEELAADTRHETTAKAGYTGVAETQDAETQDVASLRALGEAERLVNELLATGAQVQAQTGQAEQIGQLQEQLTAQSEEIQTLREQVEKVTDLLTRSLQSMAAMQRNLLRLDGEQVVCVPAQMSGNINPLEVETQDFASLHPVPKVPPAAPRGTSNMSVEQRAIQIHQQKAARMTG